MNFWGFTPRILDELAAEFPRFLQESVSVNPLKAEIYLPTVANNQLAANRATVRVLHTDESWHGVTIARTLPPCRSPWPPCMRPVSIRPCCSNSGRRNGRGDPPWLKI